LEERLLGLTNRACRIGDPLDKPRFWVVKTLSVAVGRFGSDEDEFVPEDETKLTRIA
jgi:hypothetical protein